MCTDGDSSFVEQMLFLYMLNLEDRTTMYSQKNERMRKKEGEY